MKSDVVILLAAYNGQDYIRQQLDSIAGQTYKGNITVLVRDDGSSDATAETVESYPQTQNCRIVLEKAENVGAQRSFLELIRLAQDASFYFFADQDDVWDPEKIEVAVNAMTGKEAPVAYCSNFRLSDSNLTVYRSEGLTTAPKMTPLQIIFYNQIPGCVMGFNRSLMQLLKKLELQNVMMHDSMTLSLAALCGEVVYDPAARITHRIHGGNVIGDGHKKIHLGKWIPEKFRLLRQKESYDLSEMAARFLEVAGEQAKPEYLADMELLRDFKRNWRNTRALLKHPDTQGRLNDRTVLSIRSKIFFRLF